MQFLLKLLKLLARAVAVFAHVFENEYKRQENLIKNMNFQWNLINLRTLYIFHVYECSAGSKKSGLVSVVSKLIYAPLLFIKQ